MCSSPPKEYLVFIAVAFLASLRPAWPIRSVRSQCSSQPRMDSARPRTVGVVGEREVEPASWSSPRRSPAPAARASAAPIACVAVLAPDDQLAEQRIVERRDGIAGIEQRIETHARRRPAPRSSLTVPGDGMKLFAGSSALMRTSMAWPRTAMSAWRKRSGSPPAMRSISLHQVDAGDHLGHRMLDLDAGVHLDEIEVAGRRRRRDIRACRRRDSRPPAPARRRRRRALRAQLGGQGRARAPPPTPSAGGAAASIRARRDGSTSLAVAEDLHLDVAGALDQPLEIEPAVAERGQRLGARLRHQALELRRGRGQCGCRGRRRRPPP